METVRRYSRVRGSDVVIREIVELNNRRDRSLRLKRFYVRNCVRARHYETNGAGRRLLLLAPKWVPPSPRRNSRTCEVIGLTRRSYNGNSQLIV